MTAALLFTIPLLVLWRVVQGSDGLVVDVSASLFALLYLGYLAGFCGLMLAAPDGDRRVTCFIATVVASDVGGYATGVLFGKHLLAPRISPKKSWEGLGRVGRDVRLCRRDPVYVAAAHRLVARRRVRAGRRRLGHAG